MFGTSLFLSCYIFINYIYALPVDPLTNGDSNSSTQTITLDAANATLSLNTKLFPIPFNATPHLNSTTETIYQNAATYDAYVQKGIDLYVQLMDSGTPDKADPPTLRDLTNAGWEIYANHRSPTEGDLSIPARVMASIGIRNGRDYFFEPLVSKCMCKASVISSTVAITKYLRVLRDTVVLL